MSTYDVNPIGFIDDFDLPPRSIIVTSYTKKSVTTQRPTQCPILPFTEIVFPLVRKVFPKLLSQEIISVQPMSMPRGMIFFLNYYFGKPKVVIREYSKKKTSY